MIRNTMVLAVAWALLASWGARAEELSADEQSQAMAAVKKLDSGDAAQRSDAIQDLKRLGKKAIPFLTSAKVENSDGLLALRETLMDIAVEHSQMVESDATLLMQLAREEALAKRYSNAAKGYKRAEVLYDKLKDDADNRKNEAKEAEYAGLQEKADKRKDKADALAKGEDRKVGHWGPIPTLKKVEDDGDW